MKHLRKLLSTEEFFRAFLVIIAAVSLLLVFTAVESTAGPVDKVSTGKVPVIFSYRPAAGASSVYLAGTFNNWSPTATAMSDEDGDGIYEIRLKLEPGNYQYKFVVDGQWYEDPYSVDYAPDGYGGKNSVLVVPGGVEELVVGIKSKGGEQGVAGEKAAAPTAGAGVPVTFLFDVGDGTANVYVAGTFNGWDPNKDKLTDEDGDGIYAITLELEPGTYQYKFVRDGEWITDTSAKDFADDGFGGKNSVLNVPATAAGKGLVVGMVSEVPEKYKSRMVIAGGAGGGEGEKKVKVVTFRFKPGKAVSNVFLAGTFNDWNDSKTRMTDADGDGVYEVTLILPMGRYQYKFVADGEWITDRSASEFAPDGFGGQNSVIVVDDSFPDATIEKGDGLMMNEDIPLKIDYSMVNPLSPERIEFKTRAHRGDIEEAKLIYVVDGKEKVAVLKPYGEDTAFEYYRTVLDIPASKEVHFTFQYLDGGKSFFATPGGFIEKKPHLEKMFLYSDKVLRPFFTPDWAKDGIFYQIFCDRFYNGDKSNDQDFHEPYYRGKTKLPPSGKTNGEYFHFVSQWNNVSGLTRSPYRTDGKPDYFSFYGGDIAGVMQKLPYLKDLGISIIYFNPLTEGVSNHKYDPVDYLKLDPHFADEETFIEFVNRAHEMGIRIIVDMALNHTGDWHFAFVDTREKGPKSKYWNWYEWKRWPLPSEDVPRPCDYYECWWCFGHHPSLNFDLSRPDKEENMIADINQAKPTWEVVNYLLKIPGYWIGKLGIDGFRLDVPNEVPLWFWKLFRKKVDEIKPDAFLIGEIWGNAMPWLGPDYFHSTMNYKYFRDPVLKFIGKGTGTAADFDRELAPGRYVYPTQAVQVMMNLIDSHDTERFATVAGSDDRLMLAALFQMTYVGIPQIYYGDEVGLRGGKDPDCRRTFPWGWEKSPRRKKIHDFYRKVTSIRNRYSALRTGGFRTVLTKGRVYAFLREDEKNRVLVVINNERHPSKVTLDLSGLGVDNEAEFHDELNDADYVLKNGKVAVELEALRGAVLVEK